MAGAILNQNNAWKSAVGHSTEQETLRSSKSCGFLSLVLINAGTFLFSLLLAFAGAEIVFRLFSSNTQETGGHRPSLNPVLLHEPVLGHSNTNSDGLRGREYSIVKPAGTKRILVLGDDVVYGLGIAVEDTLPKQLEAAYKANAQAVEVLNFGVSGYDTEQEIEFLKTKGLKYHPDIVILGYVLNDNRYASQELRDLSDVKYLAAPRQTIANPLKRAAASLFHSSRFLQFLGAEWHLEGKFPFLEDCPRLIDYVEEKNLRERDAPDSAHCHSHHHPPAQPHQPATTPHALHPSPHAPPPRT